MKIVIPLKDTPSAYPELKYCLRSINKFYPTDVFIVSKMKVKGTNNIYYEDKTRRDHAHPDKFIKGLPLFSTSEFSLKMIYDFMDNLFPVSDGLNKY